MIGSYNARSAGDNHEETADFHVRDITNKRSTGAFRSAELALASLKSHPEGHYSINDHRGHWCEVQVHGGDRLVRHVLMLDGNPAPFINIDSGMRGPPAVDLP
jgi:hypothetical protein